MRDEGSPVAELPAERRPLQFTVRLLLMLPVGLGLFLGIGLWLGWAAAILFLILCAVVYRPTRTLAVVVGAVLLFVALIIPAPRAAREAARRAACMNSLKHVGLALHSYHQAHGCFPPAVITDALGRPMHSWRVLILPYMEQKGLYDQYSFDEPWDGPNNKKLHRTVLDEFACFSETGPRTNTSYVAVTGPGTVWRANRGRSLDDIADDPGATILVVEMANSGIHWIEPRDLDVQKMPSGINPKSGMGVSSHHPGCANVLFADGSGRSLPEDLLPKEIQAALTIAGGEKVDPGAW